MEIGTDGTVKQGGIVLGRLELADFPVGALTKQGASLFGPAEGVSPTPALSTQVHQGKLEGSNVPSAESAVRLVSVMRHFEMLQKTITIGSEMNRRAIEEVARVGQ